MDDENPKDKVIYFIYSQKGGEENDIGKLEKNENIKNIQIIKQYKTFEYIYVLYSVTISTNNKEKMISLLLTKSFEQYEASIDCAKSYPEIFIYEIDFKPFNLNLNLNNNFIKFTLPYTEQFNIFKNEIVFQNNNLLKNLCQSTLDFIHNVALINQENIVNKRNFEFNFYLYLFLNCLTLYIYNNNEYILKLFFNEFNTNLIDINNSFNNNKNKILIKNIANEEILDLLSNFEEMRKKILLIDDKEESFNHKLEIILAYYYYNYKHRTFIDFVSEKNSRNEDVRLNLIKNRKIFKDFTSEILNFDILNEAVNLSEMQCLLFLVPNLPELLKIFSEELFYQKFYYLSSVEKKICNFIKIIKGNAEDNIELLKTYYDILSKLVRQEGVLAFILSDDFFLNYCEIFYSKDLKKIEIILEIFENYSSFQTFIDPKKFEELREELLYYYLETGKQFIKNGKLMNADFLNFIDKVQNFSKQKIDLPKEYFNCFSLIKDDKFIDDLLNNRYHLKDYYIDCVTYFFNNFKTLKDFLYLIKWKKNDCNNEKVLFICFNTLKDIWNKEKENQLSEDLKVFISELFIIVSKINNSFIDELIELDKNIKNPKLFLYIFSLVLKNFSTKPSLFEDYIKNYIYLNAKDGEPLTIYYKLLTLEHNDKLTFLKNNLTLEYAIKVEDFINFPKVTEDRLLLFVYLYKGNYFMRDFYEVTNLDYYKESINSKDKITTLKYKDAIIMCKNITDFQNVFLYLLPNRINEDNDYIVDALLIDFYETCNKCKEEYNSLKLILNYWKHFFNLKKKVEINDLIGFINILDNTPIKDFNQLEMNITSFLYYFDEAEKNDKLFNSFFFMGLYKDYSVNFKEDEEKEKFQYTLSRFNELKLLGNNSNVEILPYDLVNKLTELVYKNNDRLDDELLFIKEFFELDKNENNFNFDVFKIKKGLMNKVNNYKINKNLDDYQMEFDDFTLIKNDAAIKPNNNTLTNNINNNNINNDNDEDGFNLFTNDDNDEFTLFGNDNDEADNKPNNQIYENQIKIEKEKEKEVIKINENQKKELLKDIKQLSNDYYYLYRINYSNELFNENNIRLNQKFNDFFWETFKNINKYELLTERDFYEEILCSMTKVFLTMVGNNSFSKENNFKEIYLIYEFNEVIDIYKKYHLISKLHLFRIIEKFIEYKKNDDGEVNNIINSIDDLFTFISSEENFQKKAISNLLVKLIVQEIIKNNNNEFNIKAIDFIMRDDYKYLLIDSLPLLDEIFKEEIKSKIQMDEDNNNQITYFNSDYLNPVEKKCNTSKDFEELLLYYFESKLTLIFNNEKKHIENEKALYQNGAMKSYLRQSINLLEKEFTKSLSMNYKRISILFCLAFIKCFLNNYIKYLYNHNQELGDVNEININIIKSDSNNSFRTSLKLYVLKLFFYNLGNYEDFSQFKYTNYQIDYLEDNDIINIKEKNNDIIDNMKKEKIYGFDYLFLPLKIEEYINIEKGLLYLYKNGNQDNISNDIIYNINYIVDMDSFLCAIINIFLSNYQKNAFFECKEFQNIDNWMMGSLNNDAFNKINYLAKDLLLIFVDYNNYKNKILTIDKDRSYKTLSYNKLLTLSFSLRFVINTLLNNEKNNIFYQLITKGRETLESNNFYFNYYKNNFNSYNYRDINYLTFTIIRFIILSHLYFSYLLNNITLNDINTLFINNEENIPMINLLEQEFDLIKNIIELKGIKNIIVFMNNVFYDIKLINVEINNANSEIYIRNVESEFENEILKYIENFDTFVEKYNGIKKRVIKEEENDFKKIIFEDTDFYNNKNIDNKYPFMPLLTQTNFCSITDFENQFNYLMTDKENYPMIICLLNNLEIIKISSHLPFINSFINEIYNELILKIRKEDISKTINEVLSEKIKNKIEEYNKRINEINNLQSFYNNKFKEIYNNTKISEVINIKDNSIYKLFNNIIEVYNKFLINTKIYKDNKNLIEPIILQNASKNDFYNLGEDENNNSANDKLQEIICLYSKRNRYKKEILNVYSGSKINYDFNQIESILQKEYLYGKRPLKETQRTFIFSNEVFNEERYDLIEKIKNIYPQIEITDEILQKHIDMFFNDENKTKDDYIQIYINIQYIMIYLAMYNDNNYDSEKISLEYIAKILQKENYQINELFMEFLNLYNDKIYINNLLFLYEKIELKCFEYLTEQINNEINRNINKEKEIKINEFFRANNDTLLLKENIIINSIKKYILRYCIGNHTDKKDILQKIENGKIFNKEDIWDDKIYKNEKYKEEVEQLMGLNDDENSLMKYFLNKLFVIKQEKKIEKKEGLNEEQKEKKKKKIKKIKY